MIGDKRPSRGSSIACRDLTYSINGKVLLRHVNLLAEPGELVVVVGPSGAGKTTLLNSLALRIKGGVMNGHVLLNGRCVTSVNVLRDVCSYVMTDGRMLPYLTVLETITTAAELKLPNVTQDERKRRVERVMSELGLTKCSNTYIGGEWKKGISTGERKRVCIAVELLSEPSILLLDEPTSGLDSSLACELLSTLQKLAASGRTVICSIHQPTSQMWSQIDQLVLLSRGCVLYHGKAVDAKSYFARLGYDCPKNYNPADYFSGLISSGAYDDDETDIDISRYSTAPSYSKSNAGIELSTPEISCDNQGDESVEMMVDGHMKEQFGDMRKLVKAFEGSNEATVLKKRIEVLQSNGRENSQDNQSKTKCTVPIKSISPARVAKSWFHEIPPLYWRSFRNSIRNPVVCCVMLLVQALQGIILGGIFWQLRSGVQQHSQFVFNTTALVQNPWTQLFINGIDGRQPLLEALENGVDGKGSQPLVELWNDEKSILWLRNTTACAISRMRLGSRGYPSFGARHRKPPSSFDYDKVADETIGSIVGLLQQADYQYMKRDHTKIKAELKEVSNDNTVYWLFITRHIGADLLNPFMNCSGFPEIPGVSRLLSAIDDNTPDIQKRRLVTIGDTGIEKAMYDLIGAGSPEFVKATRDILHRVRTCENRACKWIGEKYNDAIDLHQDAFTAIMAIVNILGALFFMVANLGFASYDALLTFPQERSLFNREAANGLYRVSSYFIAKNLADFPFQIVPSFLLVTIYYLCIGIGTSFKQYIVYVIIMSGMTFAAYGFGYFVSAASPRMEIAVLIAPAILVIWLTIAGFFLRDEQIPKWIQWLSYFSFYKWGFFSLVLNQFPLDGYFGVLPNRIPIVMAGVFGYRMPITISILIALGFAYRVAACVALKFTNRSVGLES